MMIYRGARAKGLLPRVAISPGIKGCRLKCLHSLGRSKMKIEKLSASPAPLLFVGNR